MLDLTLADMPPKRLFDDTKLPHDESLAKVRPMSNQNVPRAIEAFSNNMQKPDDTVRADQQGLLAAPGQDAIPSLPTTGPSTPDTTNDYDQLDYLPINPYDPRDFAQPTDIPIFREGMIKTRARSGSTVKNKLALVRKAANSLYRYRRIRSDQIRLLVVKPAPGAPNDPLNATLMTVDDLQLKSGKHSYTALSYNWGETEADHTMIIQDDLRSRPISSVQDLVDGAMAKKGLGAKQMLIRHNLHDALRQLRNASGGKHLLIWVDALCINQGDDGEKQEQVMKMAHIYRNAKTVCIWLGTDESESRVSDTAMQFIPEAIDPRNYLALLSEPEFIPRWASLFELLRWSWFSRRWVIQELALAKYATVHCGAHTVHWNDFQDAIAIFCRDFDKLRTGLKEHFRKAHPRGRNKYPDSAFEIEQFGAKLLVDITSDLFRIDDTDGSYESTVSLERLVCSLSNFDTADPRDTVNAFLNICKEMNATDSDMRHKVPEPDYSKDLFEIYRDFVKWVVDTSKSLNIICRYWALPEREKRSPTTPRLVQLPTWILPVDESAFGRGEEVYHGRKAADSLVGLPGSSQYNASGSGWRKKDPIVEFPQDSVSIRDDLSSDHNSARQAGLGNSSKIHNMTLIATGVAIGTVSFRNQPFADGVIPRDCLEKLGWSFDRNATAIRDVPDQLWRTLVADRGPNGQAKLKTYRRASQHCLVSLTRNGHMNIKEVLRENEDAGPTKDYLERVMAVTWDRSFIEGSPIVCGGSSSAGEGPKPPSSPSAKKLVGLGPSKTQERDVIAILYGCSVPVILRPAGQDDYEFIGEAYIHGKMDGEAISEQFEERKFRLI